MCIYINHINIYIYTYTHICVCIYIYMADKGILFSSFLSFSTFRK